MWIECVTDKRPPWTVDGNQTLLATTTTEEEEERADAAYAKMKIKSFKNSDLDSLLFKKGLQMKDVEGDGNCLFRYF